MASQLPTVPRRGHGRVCQVSGMTRRELLTLGLGRASRPEPARRPEQSWIQRLDSPRRAEPSPSERREPRRIRGRSLPLHRPPGAISEDAFLAGCTSCLDCATACPHDAIMPGSARLGAAAGTPVIHAADAPCYDCADRPCASACEAGVIKSPRDFAEPMGEARVLDHSCLAVRGVGCSACLDQCPVPGAVVWDRGRPRIEASLCTGCGVCLYVCPAPQKAILLMPAFSRSSA